MKKIKIVWIDDDPKRIEWFRQVIEAGYEGVTKQAQIELVQVKKDFFSTLASWSDANQSCPPDLFAIDHHYSSHQAFQLNGSSVAHLLRRVFPETPMVCVTAILDKKDKFDQEDLSEYTAVFPYGKLADHVEDLYVIASDFKKLALDTMHPAENLVKQLKPPKADIEDVLRILPAEFVSQPMKTTPHRIARWVYGTFLRQPGFLYDPLRVATYLGLTEQGFLKIKARFAKALYKGVFATHSNPLWWSSEISRLLYDKASQDFPDIPQLAGRILPNVKSTDFSKCHVTGKTVPPPDAVAYTDETRGAKLRAVRREFTTQLSTDVGINPGFETKLVMDSKRRW
jgi:hypothetical protein